MMNDISIDKKQQLYIIKKMINIAIRVTYYIFCCRNRNLDSPDLMQFQFLLLLLFFVFVFFLIIQSQAAFVNCLYVARFTIVPSKNSNKVSIIIIISLLLFFYNQSVPLFITSANTNNVDRLLFLYSSRRAYFKAHILRGVINNSL